MKDSKPTDRARIARLRAAGLTVHEIGKAVGLSKQRVSQILATEPVPTLTSATVSIEGDSLRVTPGGDMRILHALVLQSLKRQGIKVETTLSRDD